jgi:hypothetical protein
MPDAMSTIAAAALLNPRSVTENWTPKIAMSRCPESGRESSMIE